MKHRHLISHGGWSNPKIDDVLDRGALLDWLALRDAVAADLDLAQRTLRIARAAPRYGTSNLWISYILAIHPKLTR